MKRRILAVIVAGLAAATGALMVMMGSPGAGAAPGDDTADSGISVAANPSSHYVATWNLQGSNHSTENKWNTGIAQMMTSYRLIALQEAGQLPDSAQFKRNITFAGPAGQQWTVQEHTWGGTNTRPGYHIYWLQTDPNGNRVNLAIVAASQADQVDVASGPNRPALGVRIGGDFYFSVHASAKNKGGDAPTLLNNIDNAVNGHNAYYNWYALGDYNREPKSLEGKTDFVVCPPAYPTHPATNPVSKFDYMVREIGVELSGHVLSVQLSDHLATRFSFPPEIAEDTGADHGGENDDDTDVDDGSVDGSS